MATISAESTKNDPGKNPSREIIAHTALRFIDRNGAQGLTMRSMATELDVGPTVLYRYVHGREDLLEAVVAVLLERVREDLDGELAQTCWQGYLQTLATSVRRIAVEHPAAFPLVATRHPSAPWLRPPLRSLDIVENFLATLRRHGFTDTQIVGTYRAFSSFLLGSLLLESASRGAKTSPVEVALDEGDAHRPNGDGQIDLRDKPETARLQPMLSEDHSEEEFETALETLLDRLEMTISQ